MRTRVRRRPRPLDSSIAWKPVRDSHYVVASLQPGGEGRLEIFVEQAVLTRLQDISRSSPGYFMFGLLLGERFECPDTRSQYMLIGSLVEYHAPIRDEAALQSGIQELLSQVRPAPPVELMGSYYTGSMRGSHLSHAYADAQNALFTQPWQTAVVVAEGGNSGAFHLYDRRDARWFQAPFYEVNRSVRRSATELPTCIAWPDYLTTAAVVPLTRLAESTSESPTHTHPPGARHSRSPLWRARPANATPPEPVKSGAASSSTPKPTKSRSPVELRPERVKPVFDDDDTSQSDTPARYIELARSEGFFVTMKFDAADPSVDETVWVLNEPFSGLLLTVVTTASEVLDASLHYNVRAEDAEVLSAAFPEHRDLGSRTVFVREWCVDQLRARCRRLRAAGTLERQWKVAPTIYLLTPSEWESGAGETIGMDGAVASLDTLNRRRLDSLPEPVRSQFRLTRADTRDTKPDTEENAG